MLFLLGSVFDNEKEQIILIPSLACEIGVNEAFLLGCLYDSIKQGCYLLNHSCLSEIYPIYNANSISRQIKRLLLKGYIIKHELSPIEKRDIVVNKTPSISKMGNSVCEWCNGITFVLNEHHYPIPKKDGGTETVNICPNCHYEYHSLTYILRLSDEIFSRFQQAERLVKKQ